MKSYYEETYQHNVDRKNLGFHYDNLLFTKTVSNRLIKNPMISGFLDKLSLLINEAIKSVKIIRTYRNYTVDKSDKYIN